MIYITLNIILENLKLAFKINWSIHITYTFVSPLKPQLFNDKAVWQMQCREGTQYC